MSCTRVPKVDLPVSVNDLEVKVRSVASDMATVVSCEAEKVLPVVLEVEKSFASALDSSVNKASGCLPAGFSLVGWFSPLKNYLYSRVPVSSSTPQPETLLKKVTEVVPVPDVLPVQAPATEASSEEPQQNPGQSDPSK